MTEYRDYIYCQKCEKIVAYGFIQYCHDLEIMCLECYRKETTVEPTDLGIFPWLIYIIMENGSVVAVWNGTLSKI